MSFNNCLNKLSKIRAGWKSTLNLLSGQGDSALLYFEDRSEVSLDEFMGNRRRAFLHRLVLAKSVVTLVWRMLAETWARGRGSPASIGEMCFTCRANVLKCREGGSAKWLLTLWPGVFLFFMGRGTESRKIYVMEEQRLKQFYL